jgi:hypothetical protein
MSMFWIPAGLRFFSSKDAGGGVPGDQPPGGWQEAYVDLPSFVKAVQERCMSAWQYFAQDDLARVAEVFSGYAQISAEIEDYEQYLPEYETGLIFIASLMVELLFEEDRISEIYGHSATMLRLIDSLKQRTAEADWPKQARVLRSMLSVLKEICVVKIFDNERLRNQVATPESLLALFDESIERFFLLEHSSAEQSSATLELRYCREALMWRAMPACAMAFRYCRDRHELCVQQYNSIVGDVLSPEPFHFRNQALPRDANNLYWWHQKIISSLAGGLRLEERRHCTEQMLLRENWLRNPTVHDLSYAAAHDRWLDSIITRDSGLSLV